MFNKRGSATIEALFGVMLILVVILSMANFIAISYEKNILSQKIEVLAVGASLNGGLLISERNAFLDELNIMGYDIENSIISLKRIVDGEESGNDIFLDNIDSTNYVSISSDNNQLHLRVIIPYKENTIFYSLFNDFENMTFERRFVSRRN